MTAKFGHRGLDRSVGSLFSGIGGFDLGFEAAGFDIRWQVEVDEYARRVLAKNFPGVPIYEDIREVEWSKVEPVGTVIAGFPCQPVSLAGVGAGTDDERWLFPEIIRCVRVLRPRVAVLENVPGLLARGMGGVLGQLSEVGYSAEWECISAQAVGAPHIRDRVFVVAYPDSEPIRVFPERLERYRWGFRETVCESPFATYNGDARNLAHPDRERLQRVEPTGAEAEVSRGAGELANSDRRGPEQSSRVVGAESGRACYIGLEGGPWTVEPDVGRVANGVPARVDRLRTLGSAIVPQVAEYVARRIARCLYDARTKTAPDKCEEVSRQSREATAKQERAYPEF